MNTPHEHSDDDAALASLLQEAGAREAPSAAMMAQIQAAVHAEWREVVQQRQSKRRRMQWSLAASVAVAVAGSLLALRIAKPPALQVATIERLNGHPLVADTDSSSPAIAVGQAVARGEALHTDADSRLALRWPSGMSVRLDHDTDVRIAAADRIELTTGAIYIDASSGHSSPLTIESPLGLVQHVGTRYEVRTEAQALQVTVRDGRVSIRHDSDTLVAQAGDRLRLDRAGNVQRQRISAQDDAWAWATDAAPVFQIENQSLAAFLDWVAHETGRQLVYESPQAKDAAAHVMLRGTIEGLGPDTALTTVLSTTQLRRYETKDDSIGIALNRD